MERHLRLLSVDQGEHLVVGGEAGLAESPEDPHLPRSNSRQPPCAAGSVQGRATGRSVGNPGSAASFRGPGRSELVEGDARRDRRSGLGWHPRSSARTVRFVGRIGDGEEDVMRSTSRRVPLLAVVLGVSLWSGSTAAGKPCPSLPCKDGGPTQSVELELGASIAWAEKPRDTIVSTISVSSDADTLRRSEQNVAACPSCSQQPLPSSSFLHGHPDR